MSQQPSVASFFGKRKRIVSEDIYKAKVLKKDKEVFCSSSVTSDCFKPKTSLNLSEEIVNKEKSNSEVKNIKPSQSAEIQTNKENPKIQLDIRESLKRCQEKQSRSSQCLVSPVKFQLLGSLSPIKKNNNRNKLSKNESVGSLCNNETKAVDGSNKVPSVKNLEFNENAEGHTEDIIKSAKQLVFKLKETQKKLKVESSHKKELSLKDIKDKIKRSSKLSELKKSINKINEHAEELIELEKKKLTGAQPKLSKFKAIEVEVPLSPKKNALYSPVKQHPRSPGKPAYERFASLVDTTSSLPLPFGFQRIFELFKAADTVCSMMINRGEVITFNKLKPAVEEMTRKNFTLRHLGQMATVLPDAYSFHQEKLRNFGSTSKVDKYELVITPTIPRNQGSSSPKTPVKEDEVFRLADRSIMTPKVIKARRESFYNSLLERTKDYHDEFLKTLDPPITISRSDLKRWHPNFMVDLVPDVNPQELPQPPTSEKPTTAKEILERAKDFLSSNARLHKALEVAAGSNDSSSNPEPKVSLEIKEKVDARLNNPLKGISKSLLEKVRARQAAKALDAMRMSSEQGKETLMYARLPEIARIVRTVFINEQKGVLLLETVLEKVQFSFNRNLSLSHDTHVRPIEGIDVPVLMYADDVVLLLSETKVGLQRQLKILEVYAGKEKSQPHPGFWDSIDEIEAHVRLLTQKLPEWLSIIHIRYSDYLKINRSIDVTSVLTKLNKMVEDKKQEIKAI